MDIVLLVMANPCVKNPSQLSSQFQCQQWAEARGCMLGTELSEARGLPRGPSMDLGLPGFPQNRFSLPGVPPHRFGGYLEAPNVDLGLSGPPPTDLGLPGHH